MCDSQNSNKIIRKYTDRLSIIYAGMFRSNNNNKMLLLNLCLTVQLSCFLTVQSYTCLFNSTLS